MKFHNPIWLYKSETGPSGALRKFQERLTWIVDNPIDSGSGMATLSLPKKIVIPVYENKNFTIHASNTKEGPFDFKTLEKFYTISAYDFAQCGESLGIPSLEFGKKRGSSIMLEYIRGNLSKLNEEQQKQFLIWRQQNKDNGRYDAFFYLQIFPTNQYVKRDFENCIELFKREELPNGQIHLY